MSNRTSFPTTPHTDVQRSGGYPPASYHSWWEVGSSTYGGKGRGAFRAFTTGMSWERAQREAKRWIDGLNIPTRQLQGQSFDLTPHAASLAFEPKFKSMVITAAKRLLKTRGVEAYVVESDHAG